MEIKRIAIDTSKHVFTLHGVDERDHPVLRRELRRNQLEPFFSKLRPSEVVLEACGGSHHWGRTLAAMGHQGRLIPPQYVKPFVKRGKNDRNDAEAISEAAARPTMRSVPVKSAEAQAEAMVLSVRELLVKQRTQLVNALRGHAAEFGFISAKGVGNAATLSKRIESDATLPATCSWRSGARSAVWMRRSTPSTARSQHSTRPIRSANCLGRFRGSGRSAHSPWR